MNTLLNLDLHSPIGVALALFPAVINAGLVLYAIKALPRDRITSVFLFFTAMLMVWQFYHVGIRASNDAQTATLWRGFLGFGFLLSVPAGVHLAFLFAGHDSLARNPLAQGALYGPAAFFEGSYRAGFNGDEIVAHPLLGWIAGGDLSTHGRLLALWAGALTVMMALVLWWAVWRYRNDPQRRDQALLLAGGVSVPVSTGFVFEILFPQLLGLPPLPITSTTVTAYSLAALLAMTQLDLFTFSPDAAAEAVLETVNDLVVVTDDEGRLLNANTAAIRAFGLVRGRLHEYDIHDLFPPIRTDQDFHRAVWMPTRAGRNVSGYATRVLPRTGAPVPVLVSTARIPMGGLGPPAVLLVANDVSALKKTEEALWTAKQAAEQANAAKSRFLSNMTQALLPPLDTVLEKSAQLEEWASRNQYVHLLPELKEVRQAGQTVHDLVDDILDLTRIESGRMQLFSDEIDVHGLIATVSETAYRLCSQSYNELIVDVHPDAGVLQADRGKLTTVLVNLITYAAESCEEGQVTISAQPRSIGVVPGIAFGVSDTGEGLEADDLALLFKAFNEIVPQRRRRFGETGVGLTLARQYCRLMGGEISVQSTPGQGTRFDVWIPLDAVPEAKAKASITPMGRRL